MFKSTTGSDNLACSSRCHAVNESTSSSLVKRREPCLIGKALALQKSCKSGTFRFVSSKSTFKSGADAPGVVICSLKDDQRDQRGQLSYL